MFNKKKILLVIFCLAFLSIGVLIYKQQQNKSILEVHGVIVNGTITNVTSCKGLGPCVDYTFEWNGEIVHGTSKIIDGNASEILELKSKNVKIPIVVDPANPSNSVLLLTKFGFEQVGREYPDTMDNYKNKFY